MAGATPCTLRAALPLIYARYFLLSSNSRKLADFWFVHVVFGKLAPTFPQHAPASHAYTECRHVAQSFALPNFPATQHDAFDSTGRAFAFCALPVVAFWEEGLSEGF
jgi:hypothetical protein